MEISDAYKVLELTESASWSDVEQQYRDLASVWHPDRHTHNKRLQDKASEKMKELNEARSVLRAFFADKAYRSAQEENSTRYNQNIRYVKCNICGATNRYRIDRKISILKCGKCKSTIWNYSSDVYDYSERILCPDGNCIGIIGPDGRCSECGRTKEEYDSWEEEQYIKRNRSPKSYKRLDSIIWYVVALFFVIVPASLWIIHRVDTSKKHTLPIASPKPASISTSEKPEPKTSRSVFSKAGEVDYTSFCYNIEQNRLTENDFVNLISNLRRVGYEIPEINTDAKGYVLRAMFDFCETFGIKQDDKLFATIQSELNFHAKIADHYKGWIFCVKNGDFEKWIKSKNKQYYAKLRESLNSKNERIIQKLLDLYEFDKLNLKALPIPTTQVYLSNELGFESPARLVIKTPKGGVNYFIKLVSLNTSGNCITGFIRGGETLTIYVPLGVYELRYVCGKVWYGEKYLFGPYGSYNQADETFNFKRTGDYVVGYTVELIKQAGGNLKTVEISVFDF